MPSLSELKESIKLIIPQGVDQALKQLEAVLRPEASRFNEFLQIKARYAAYLSSIIRGDSSTGEQNTLYNGIAYALMLYTDSLQESDFNMAPASSPVPAKQGELLYSIPHQMEQNRDYRCAVRVAYLKEVIRRDWEAKQEEVQQSIRVAEVMSVELINLDEQQPFAIRALSETVQFLDPEDFTEWVFFVKPVLLGEFPLILKVAVLEVRNGREVRKDVVIEEHIQVSNNAPEPVQTFVSGNLQVSFASPQAPGAIAPPSAPVPEKPEEAEGTVKSADSPGQANVRPEKMPPDAPDNSPGGNRGLKALALFFVFILLGSSATWAFTPPETRDWVVTRYVRDDEQSYSTFIEKYPQSQRLETAVYRKTVVAPTVTNLKQYTDRFPVGTYKNEIGTKLKVIESSEVQEIHKDPRADNVRRFLRDFPESDHLPEVSQVVGSKPELKKDLLPEMERTYLDFIRKQPDARHIRTYLKAFPDSEKLPELKRVIDEKPEIRKDAAPILENAYLEGVRRKPEVQRVRAFLRDFPVSDSLPVLKRVVESRPVLKREVLTEVVAAENRRKLIRPERGVASPKSESVEQPVHQVKPQEQTSVTRQDRVRLQTQQPIRIKDKSVLRRKVPSTGQ